MILLLACVEAEPEVTFGSPAEAVDEETEVVVEEAVMM